MRVTSKGQVTIPQDLRNKMGIFPYSEVNFELTPKGILITRGTHNQHMGKSPVARMRGKATVHLRTDEIMALTRE